MTVNEFGTKYRGDLKLSNKTHRLAKKIRKIDPLYNTLTGSVICTIGIINRHSEKECRALFNTLKRRQSKLALDTVSKIMDYVWSIFGKDENIHLRANAVLVYDKLNIRTPLVTLVNEDGNLLPLKRDGEFTGILLTAAAGSNLVNAEFLYNEDGTEITEEENK